MAATFLFEGFRTSYIYHTPRVFSYVEISHTVGLNANEWEGARSVSFGCH